MTQGIFAIFTGNGKGKTTSALGHIARAVGQQQKVCVIQFIKGSWTTGEETFFTALKDSVDFYVMGRGFTWKSDDLEKDKEVAREAWEFAKKIIASNHHDLIILDELTYLVRYNMIDEDELLHVITSRDKELHIIMTGRYATEKMIAKADLVTEMMMIKHPYEKGINAQAGFDF